jgi:pyruvate dehydrogenase E1 component
MNENYRHPALPEGAEDGVIKGMYRLQVADDPENPKLRVNLLGSGAILNEVLAAAEILASVYGVAADVWSITSFSELRREGLAVARYNLLHPEETPREAYVTRCLKTQPYPIVAASDYMKIVAEQIRPFIHGPYLTLGTDGYGRSDTREQLRRHFEVDRYFIAVAALHVLADKGVLGRSRVADAIARFQIDPDKLDPVMV